MNPTIKKNFLVEFYLFKKNFWLILLIPILMIYFSVMLIRNLIFFLSKPTTHILKDFGFKIIPEIKYDFVQNMPQWFIWTSTIALIIVPIFKKEYHEKKIFGVSRFITVYTNLTLMHLIRGLNYHITRMQSPNRFCINLTNEQKPQSIFECFYKVYNHTCGDLLFSGHNANTMIIILNLIATFWSLSTKKNKIIMLIIFGIVILLQGFFSISTRRYILTI